MKKSHNFQIFKNSDKSNQNISQKTDSGRSMVEMLGVLAVIGVLTITALMGYRYAMDKYKANQTINDVNLRATTIEMQLAQNYPVSLNEFSATSTVGYSFLAPAEDESGNILLSIQNLPERVCEIVKDGLSHYEIIINDNIENLDCTDAEAGNKLTFILNEGVGNNNAENGDDPIDDDPLLAGVPTEHDWPKCVISNKSGIDIPVEFEGIEACSETDTLPCEETQYLYKNECVDECPAGTIEAGGLLDEPRICASGCKTNNDCKSGEYCYIGGYDNDRGCPEFNLGQDCATDNDGNPVYGDCRNAKQDAIRDSGGTVISTLGMTLQSANRFCAAFNKNVVTTDMTNVGLPKKFNGYFWLLDNRTDSVYAMYLIDADVFDDSETPGGQWWTMAEPEVTEQIGLSLLAVCR